MKEKERSEKQEERRQETEERKKKNLDKKKEPDPHGRVALVSEFGLSSWLDHLAHLDSPVRPYATTQPTNAYIGAHSSAA